MQNSSTNDSGYLFDNGSDTGNYFKTSNMSYFKSTICKSILIELRFKTLKLSPGNGNIFIYDGKDESGKLLSPYGINNTNQHYWRNKVITATSGSFYITFNASSAAMDSGFALFWKAQLDTVNKPKVIFNSVCDTIYTGNMAKFLGEINTSVKGVSWEYFIPGSPYLGFSKNFNYTFNSTGKINLCLAGNTCFGSDTFCKTLQVQNVTSSVDLDFNAEDIQPEIGKKVQLFAQSCKASNFEWSIFPLSFLLHSGTNMNSEIPVVSFTKDTCYTIKLIAWNNVKGKTASEKTVVKTNLICVKKYNPVLVSGNSSIYKPVQIGLYPSYPQDSFIFQRDTNLTYQKFDTQPIMDGYCSSAIPIRIVPNNKIDSFKYAVFIDLNRNGKFNDFGEKMFQSNIEKRNLIESYIHLARFSYQQKDFGLTRIRIVFTAKNAILNSDTILGDGSITDIYYRINKHLTPPIITSDLNDTLRIMVNDSSNCKMLISKGNFKATDKHEGDLTNQILYITDLNCSIKGNYYVKTQVCNCAGICSEKYYTILVLSDTTPPKIELNTSDTICHQINTTYNSVSPTVTDPPNSPSDVSLVKSGTVNTNVKGLYIETFTATDKFGNSSVKKRYVKVDSCNVNNIKNNFTGNHLEIYPNPVNNYISFQNINTEKSIIIAEIYNVNGVNISKHQFNTATSEVKIATTLLPNGLYMLSVTNVAGRSTYMFIVSHD